jgi:16S rRNA processing protein RimM
VFVECNKHLVPFLLKAVAAQKTIFRIRFEDIPKKMPMHYWQRLISSLKYVTKLTGNKFYFHEVIGFEVEDKRLGVVGKLNP